MYDMNYLNLVNKKIVAIYENQIVGTVETVLLRPDWKRVVGIKAKGVAGESFLIELRKVFAIGEHAVVVRNTSACHKTMQAATEAFAQGASMLTIQGKSVGTLNNIEFDTHGKQVALVSSEQTKLLPNQIVCKDKEMLLLTEEPNRKHHHFKPRNHLFALASEKEIMVKVLEEQEETAPSPLPSTTEEVKVPFNAKAAVPSRIVSSHEYLIGKKVITDIVGLRNEILLRKGQVINEKHIMQVKQHGKIRELMLLSQ